MDMSVGNLFKHKVRFEQSGHDSDWDEPCVTNKGYHYSSDRIENGESVGIRSASDLFIDKLKPLFLHIISTMYHEAEMEIHSITITVIVWGLFAPYNFGVETYHDFDVVKYEFTSPPNDAIKNYSRSWVYPFPERILNNKFSIYIQSYVYMVDDYIRAVNAAYDEQLRLSHQEVEENEPLAPPVETYRQDCCVVCLESKPNILYLDCMHIAICDSCDRIKSKTSSQSTCDICRAEISKRIKI